MNKRDITPADLWQIAACIVGIVVLVACTDCASPPRAEFALPSTTITCDSARNITADYDERLEVFGLRNNNVILGYQSADKIKVMWSMQTDKNGDPLPDFEVLGHEVWHRVKGNWHE